jgi:hypothetical protein
VSDDPKLRDLFSPRTVVQVNERPLQRPGLDRLVRTATVGGPDQQGDRRVFLSAPLLEQCLRVARSSSTGRCALDRAGVRIDLYEDGKGHTYEVWTLIGIGPKPEPLPAVLGGQRSGS